MMTPRLTMAADTPSLCQFPEKPDIHRIARFILSVQRATGEIPWSAGGKTDPWDHVESAMGLTVAGFKADALAAFHWLAEVQLADGAWWSEYRNGTPIAEAFKDTNMSAYIAVGLYHYFQTTGDLDLLHRLWPTLEKAIEFVIGMQAPGGEIYWAKRADGSIDRKALLTGSSSMFFSLSCAIAIAIRVGRKAARWQTALAALGNAIENHPEKFDLSKSRFAMDWYYPILCGAISGRKAEMRINNAWEKFVVPGWGVRCVSDHDWVTMAETAELALTLGALNRTADAGTVFSLLKDKYYGDGAFFTGITFPDKVIYTEEKTTWTSAAILLATDRLFKLTPAWNFFSHEIPYGALGSHPPVVRSSLL